MSKSNISKEAGFIDYLLNDKIPITDRLNEYDKRHSLFMVSSPAMLYPHFNYLFNNNTNYQTVFVQAKKRSIEAIREKRSTFSYEDFLRHLFFELDYLNNRYTDQDGAIVFDVTPKNESEIEVMDNLTFEYLNQNIKKVSRLKTGFNSFDLLKQEYQKRIGNDGSDKANVIEGMRKQFVETIKSKDKALSKIYLDRLEGLEIKPNLGKVHSFSFFSGKHKVLEIMKFEMYLLNDCKENKKKAGQKAIPKLSAEQYLLVSDDDKQRFLDKLKEKYKDEGKKEFCYLLIGLNQLKLLNAESQQNVFEVISKYFDGYYGSYSNFNKHWTNPNNIDLLKMTKEQIKNIKLVNVIM